MFFTEITDADLQQATLPRTTFKVRLEQPNRIQCVQAKVHRVQFSKRRQYDGRYSAVLLVNSSFMTVEMEKGKTERLCVLAERTYWGYMNDETLNTTTNFWNSNYYSGDCVPISVAATVAVTVATLVHLVKQTKQ